MTGKPGRPHTEETKRRISETKRRNFGPRPPLVPQLCACGCGEYTTVDERAWVVRTWVAGHQNRTRTDEDGLLTCRDCRRKLPLSEFSKLHTVHLGVRSVCKSCTADKVRQWRDQNPDKHLAAHLLRKFGITLEHYSALLAEQGGVCAICGDPPTMDNSGRWAKRRKGQQTEPRLVVDHDHATGAVRGLLCGQCNAGIGFLRDDAATVRFALKYLEERSGG